MSNDESFGLDNLALSPRARRDSSSEDDIFITYDKGIRTDKFFKSILISHSKWFEEGIGPNPYSPDAPNHVELRGDHPFCILAMLHYFHSGSYSWGAIPREITNNYPRTTTFDFHVLMYHTSGKYEAPRLGAYAKDRYMQLVNGVVLRDIPALQRAGVNLDEDEEEEQGLDAIEEGDEGQTDGAQDTGANMQMTTNTNAVVAHTRLVPMLQMQGRIAQLFNSVTLLWNYADEKDELKEQLLHVLKTHLARLVKVREFKELIWLLPGFKKELDEALAEDGHELVVIKRRPGQKRRAGLWFE